MKSLKNSKSIRRSNRRRTRRRNTRRRTSRRRTNRRKTTRRRTTRRRTRRRTSRRRNTRRRKRNMRGGMDGGTVRMSYSGSELYDGKSVWVENAEGLYNGTVRAYFIAESKNLSNREILQQYAVPDVLPNKDHYPDAIAFPLFPDIYESLTPEEYNDRRSHGSHGYGQFSGKEELARKRDKLTLSGYRIPGNEIKYMKENFVILRFGWSNPQNPRDVGEMYVVVPKRHVIFDPEEVERKAGGMGAKAFVMPGGAASSGHQTPVTEEVGDPIANSAAIRMGFPPKDVFEMQEKRLADTGSYYVNPQDLLDALLMNTSDTSAGRTASSGHQTPVMEEVGDPLANSAAIRMGFPPKDVFEMQEKRLADTGSYYVNPQDLLDALLMNTSDTSAGRN